ncbi:hypothetical protein C4A77_11480 [Brevibacillus laterosporus]|uniref:DUF1361 domain-containing protein n=2 Tax=Brevibacillus laterosporus TaxID=1465 RepID=A0AAP8QDP5_BRELA|nr:hypothetical protein C4A77_11480 [Brevibacillus laterosporus]
MHQGMEFFWLSACGKQTSPLYAVFIESIRLFCKLQILTDAVLLAIIKQTFPYYQRSISMSFLKQKPLMYLFNVMVLMSAGSAILWIYRVMDTGRLTFRWLLIPNLVLAWIPFIMALILFDWYQRKQRFSIGMLPIAGVWLFFLPNAAYIVTDIVHLTTLNIRYFIYYDVTLNFYFALTGIILGFLSLALLHQIWAQRFGSLIGWLFVLITQLLTGIGVYLGRFLRWNSWDIIQHPVSILTHAMEAIFNQEAVLFIIHFSIFVAFVYPLFYVLIRPYVSSLHPSQVQAKPHQ